MTKEPQASTLITDDDKLAALLAPQYPPASATFINDTPPAWNVHIVQIGCKFIYDDGTNDNKGANVSIPGGGAQETLTASYSGCCRAYFVVMKAKEIGGSGQVWDLFNNATVPSGYCGANLKWHLVPETKVESGARSGAAPILRLEPVD